MNAKTGTLMAAVLGSGIVFLDSTVVNVALQKIGEELPSSFAALEGESYVYNAYLLSLSALLILSGALADAFGRRRFFVLGLVGFGVSSILCGFAPNMELLIVFGIVQGAAGALLVPGSLALLTHTFVGAERGRAFGVWAAASATTAIARAGRRRRSRSDDFMASRLLHQRPPDRDRSLGVVAVRPGEPRPGCGHSFDWIGAAVVALAVGGLSFGAIYGQQHQWRDAMGPVALAVGAVATILFVGLVARRATARAPGPVPVPQLLGHEPLDVPDLRGLVRRGLPAIDLHPGDAWLLGIGGGLHRRAGRLPAGSAVVPSRRDNRTVRHRASSWRSGPP